jgi:plasmid stabilization system protein ParE
MAQIIWTEPALSDLEAIADYIALENPTAAANLVKQVFAHITLLASHPELGPRIPELRPGFRCRQIVEPSCRIFYRYDRVDEIVFVLGVMRSERRFRKRLLQRSDKPAR